MRLTVVPTLLPGDPPPGPPAPPDDPAADLALLRRYLQARASAAEGTRTLIETRARGWIIHLHGRYRSLLAAGADDAAAFLAAREGMGWSVHTQRRAASILRDLHRWLAGVAGTLNPWDTAQAPGVPRRIPPPATGADMALLGKAPRPQSPRDVRDRALLLILRTAGMTAGQARAMNLVDLDLPNGRASTWTRTGREVRIFFGAETAEALTAWLAVGRPAWARRPGMGAVFIGRSGGRLGPTALRDVLLRAAKRERAVLAVKARSELGRRRQP